MSRALDVFAGSRSAHERMRQSPVLLMRSIRSLTLLGLAAVLGVAVTASATLAGKPAGEDGIYLGNGFPSGPHFNLNIIGKKDSFTCPQPQYEWTITGTTDGHSDGHVVGQTINAESCPAGHTCDQGPQVFGNVIFVPRVQAAGPGGEPVPIDILMESGAKGPKGATETTSLQVTDWCSEQFDGDAATLRLPRDPDGYAVFARILAKPGQDGGPSFDFTSRNLVLVQDEMGNDLVLLGLVNETGAFDPITLTRYDTSTSGKGAKRAVDITKIFTYTGDVCYINDVDYFCPDFGGTNPAGCTLRVDENGVQQPVCCAPVDPDTGTAAESCSDTQVAFAGCVDSTFDSGTATYVCPSTIDLDGVEPEETACAIVPVCRQYTDQWIFNIADFVNVLYGVQNDGAYLVNIRFYPLPLK